MFTNTVPWDGSGTDVTDCSTLAEAIHQAGADYEVEVRQGYFPSQRITKNAELEFKYHSADGFYYVVRVNESDSIALGQCKGRFTPLQNSEAFEFIEPLIANGTVALETIGVIGEGEKMWALCKIDTEKFSVINGDEIELYLFIMNAHDASTKVTIGVVPIRVWCANMFAMIARGDFDVVKIKHSGNVQEKLAAIQGNITEQIKYTYELRDMLKIMSTVQVSPEDLNKYFRTVFKVKEGASTQLENKIKKLMELFILGKGNQLEGVRGSWYAAYNAVSEYLNYEHGRNATNRLLSLWTGPNKDVSNKALTLAYANAKGG